MVWEKRKTCRHDSSSCYVIVKRNGTRAVVELCTSCYTNVRGAGIFLPSADYDLDDLYVIADNRSGAQPCARCGMWETELHHWAPRHLFDDADEWPVDYLCKTCHSRWHREIVRHFQAAS